MKANTHKTASISFDQSLVKNKTLFNYEKNLKIFNLRVQGESYNSIARQVNLSPQRVAEILKDYKEHYKEVEA